MLKVKSSRRVAGLKESDYDHEIGLVDHDEEDYTRSTYSSSPGTRRASTVTRLLSAGTDSVRRSSGAHPHREDQHDGPSRAQCNNGTSSNEHARSGDPPSSCQEDLQPQESLPHPSMQPSIEVEAATPDVFSDPEHRIVPRRPREARETAIDIMYENERGGFLCGTAVFSAKALGGLDAPPWTNAFHKSSPTDINTAEVPDPSWEWIWPEWRVNHQEGMDEGGWEYSFAFSKKFSWHGARWWNSFVRRRAWIRKRARKRPEDMSSDIHMPNSDYFTVRPASSRSKRLSTGSFASSRVPSKASLTHTSIQEVDEAPPHIEDIDTLLHALRMSRIDREKREVVESYLEDAIDLHMLQEEMHEIMSIFVFQASRRQLLTHLMRKYDETVHRLEDKETEDTAELEERKKALHAAVKHADEEVAQLAYWSDVKQMSSKGELRLSLDEDQGWYDARPGLDRSGPANPRHRNAKPEKKKKK